MKPETKSCQNCKNNFTVESEDFLFYEKIKVPPPTFCPECRFKRRLMWRNNRSLYSRVCGLCSKKLVSYMKDDGVPVYCLSCYPSDNWDQFAHAQEVDFSKSFFEQFKELLQKQPRVAQMVYGSVVNCDYSNSVVDGKNLYLTFSSMSSENIFYSENVDKSKDCFDCLSVQELSQCSWNVNSEKNYNSHYMYDQVVVLILIFYLTVRTVQIALCHLICAINLIIFKIKNSTKKLMKLRWWKSL